MTDGATDNAQAEPLPVYSGTYKSQVTGTETVFVADFLYVLILIRTMDNDDTVTLTRKELSVSQTHGETWDIFDDIESVNAWLDSSNAPSPHDDSMRVLKVGEEIGEFVDALVSANGRACAAYIGMTGQNPRKGITHTMGDVNMELADIAVTALAAIQHNTGNIRITRGLVAAKLSQIISRANIPLTGETT